MKGKIHYASARCPSDAEKKYYFGQSFHPEKPLLCFYDRGIEGKDNDH